MSKKYEGLAQQIVDLVGGKDNVANVVHCQTRLRFNLKDDTKADRQAIKNIDGVLDIVEKGGQFQIVIGMHVAEVFEEVEKIVGVSSGESSNESTGKKQNPLNLFVEFITSIFQPILPVIAGSGMIKAVLAILSVTKIVAADSQTYIIINMMADAMFYFLPFLLASTTARRLKTNPAIAMGLAGVLLHPTLIALVTAGEPVHIFGAPMTLVNYGTSMFPIVLIVLCQSYIEKFMNKITPNSLKLIIVPMVTILVTGFLGLTILGPVGSFIGQIFLTFFNFISQYGPWVLPFILATFWPIFVMFGIHPTIATISPIQFASVGYETNIGPGAMVSNISQGTAALVAGIRMNKGKDRQLALSTGFTALMGITEPVIYGVNLPKKYPLIGGMIGSAAGGLYAGLNHVARYGVGHSGIPAIPLYLGEDIRNLYNILIAIVITMVVSAVATFILSTRFEKKNNVIEENELVVDEKEVILTDTFLGSPLNGEVLPLSAVKDAAFSSEALGKGFAIQPSNGRVVAPFDGEVVTIFPSKHAIGLVSESGVEVLIHVGLDTVELNGEHFEAFVQNGDKVKKGQLLVDFELDKLEEKGYVTQVPVVVTNTHQYSSMQVIKQGKVTEDEEVLKIQV